MSVDSVCGWQLQIQSRAHSSIHLAHLNFTISAYKDQCRKKSTEQYSLLLTTVVFMCIPRLTRGVGNWRLPVTWVRARAGVILVLWYLQVGCR
jgi:hypothetical protein